jgi:hypothetical protein
MDLELLQSISLAVSQVRTVEIVLKMIVTGLVDTPGVAWLESGFLARATSARIAT